MIHCWWKYCPFSAAEGLSLNAPTMCIKKQTWWNLKGDSSKGRIIYCITYWSHVNDSVIMFIIEVILIISKVKGTNSNCFYLWVINVSVLPQEFNYLIRSVSWKMSFYKCCFVLGVRNGYFLFMIWNSTAYWIHA